MDNKVNAFIVRSGNKLYHLYALDINGNMATYVKYVGELKPDLNEIIFVNIKSKDSSDGFDFFMKTSKIEKCEIDLVKKVKLNNPSDLAVVTENLLQKIVWRVLDEENLKNVPEVKNEI